MRLGYIRKYNSDIRNILEDHGYKPMYSDCSDIYFPFVKILGNGFYYGYCNPEEEIGLNEINLDELEE